MHIKEEPRIPSQAAPHREITAAADALILKAMTKIPAGRYQTMDEFRNDLQHCYGKVAFKRNANAVAGVKPVGKEGRTRRLTEELDEWLHGDQPTLSEKEARMIAMIGEANEAFDKSEQERLADALDAALEDED